MVLLLLGRGAETSCDRTPLDLAKTMGHTSTVDVLLKANTREHFQRCIAAEVPLVSVVHGMGGDFFFICSSIHPRVLTLYNADSTCCSPKKSGVNLVRLL